MRMLKGLVRSTCGSTMRVELENGLIVETENHGGFASYDLVEVAFDFCRREVVRVEHEMKDRLAYEETATLECPEPEEECTLHAGDGVDLFPITIGPDAMSFGPEEDYPEGPRDLAPNGAELGDLGYEDPGLEVSRDLAPDGAHSGLEVEFREILDLE